MVVIRSCLMASIEAEADARVAGAFAASFFRDDDAALDAPAAGRTGCNVDPRRCGSRGRDGFLDVDVRFMSLSNLGRGHNACDQVDPGIGGAICRK